MSDTNADVDHEGGGEDHAVPADLVELHEILDYQEQIAKGPNR